MNRIDKIKDILNELGLDAIYITHIPNIRYISGFSGSSAYILITKNKNFKMHLNTQTEMLVIL